MPFCAMLKVRSCTNTSVHRKPPCPLDKPAYPLQAIQVQRLRVSTHAKRAFCSPPARFRTKTRNSPCNPRLNSTPSDLARPITVKTRRKDQSLRPKPNSEVKLSRIRSILLTLGEASGWAPRYPGPLTPARSYQVTTCQSISASQLSLLSDMPSIRPKLQSKTRPGLRVNTDPEGISAWEAETEGRPSSNLR